jgi:hypothetical protein
MLKERSFVSILLGIPLLILACYLRPRPVGVAVIPLSGDPVHQAGPVGERFWVLKAQAKTRFDMLLMGDSRVYRGLSPQVMETILPGYRILNYGFSGGGLNPVMYAATEQRLDPHSRQMIIVFGVTPLTLTPRAAKNEHYLQELHRPADYVFLRLYGRPLLDLFKPISLNGVSNASLEKNPQPTKQGYYQEYHDDGWIASWMIPENIRWTLPSFRDIFSQTSVSQELVQDLMEQTRRWRERGIRVFAFRVPSSQAMVDLENQMSGFDEAAFAEQFESAGGVWLSIPLEPYHSYDGSHLVKQSAIQLSEDLANLIKNSLENNR